MKFNEKLNALREEQGLSQKQLGAKLNVTEETISKWELEDTIPESEKLMAISKIFNVSVDDLINDSKIINNSNQTIKKQPIKNNNIGKITKVTIIGIIGLVILILIIKIFISFNIFNKVKDIFNRTENQIGEIQQQQELQENIFDKVFDLIKTILNNYDIDLEDINIDEEQIDKDMLLENLNDFLEMYNGTNNNLNAIELIDDIIKSNENRKRKITIQYDGMEIKDVEQLNNLKNYLKNGQNYEISFDYDENGAINKVIIEESAKNSNEESGINALDRAVDLKVQQTWKNR